jgi:hypothetical protein
MRLRKEIGAKRVRLQCFHCRAKIGEGRRAREAVMKRKRWCRKRRQRFAQESLRPGDFIGVQL